MNSNSNKQQPDRGENDARNTGKDENEFPGYPHYPAKEDIMSASSDMKRVEIDVENLTPSGKYISTKDTAKPVNEDAAPSSPSAEEDELQIVRGTEADVTRDDLAVLGGRNFKDEDLQGNTKKQKMVTGDDLDIPGSELDNNSEAIGEEDEENNYYSLGGDRHEDLEEDRTV